MRFVLACTLLVVLVLVLVLVEDVAAATRDRACVGVADCHLLLADAGASVPGHGQV